MTRRRPAKHEAAALAHATRAKLMVLLPLTMALLVGATGFFTLSMAERFSVMYPGASAWRAFAGQLGVQIALISVTAALVGLSLAIGITRPVRQMTEQLGAIAAGDLRGALDIRSISELDSLAGAFNGAVEAVNRYLFQGLTGAALTTDAQGTIIAASASAESVIGRPEYELVGRRLTDVLSATSGSRGVLAAIDEAFRQRRPLMAEDLEIIGPEGKPVRVSLTASYLRGGATIAGEPEQDVVGVLITFKDLSEIRRLRDRLRQADRLVALGTVTAGVAHELRNPLASIRGLTELLGRDFAADDPRQRYVATMLTAIDRLNRIIEDLLLFSSPSPATSDEVDLSEMAERVAAFTGHGQRGRIIRVEAAGPVFVVAHRDRLEQALTNVLANAVQATPEGGVVTARVNVKNDEALLEVHNTGSYIPPDVRAQIFVPFFTTKPTGTGLGLAIARHFVTAAGGRIDAQSDPGAGTTFSIELPLARQAGAAVAAALASGGRSHEG